MIEQRVLHDIQINLDENRCLKRMGYKSSEPVPGHILEKFSEIFLNARSLIEPCVTYSTKDVLNIDEGTIRLSDGVYIESTYMAQVMAQAHRIVFYTASIGRFLEEEIERYESQNDILGTFIIDSIGSEATEMTARKLNEIIKIEARSRGYSITKRKSPGYGDFQLSFQKELLRISGGRSIGVKVNDRHILYPRKSTTGIIGII